MRYLDESRYDSFGDYVNTQSTLPPDQVNDVTTDLAGSLTGEATFTPITTSVNDYPLSSGVSLRIATTANGLIITGLANVWTGRIIFIINAGSFAVALSNQDAGSQAQNRIITGSGGAILVNSDEARALIYDGTSQRWRLLTT